MEATVSLPQNLISAAVRTEVTKVLADLVKGLKACDAPAPAPVPVAARRNGAKKLGRKKTPTAAPVVTADESADLPIRERVYLAMKASPNASADDVSAKLGLAKTQVNAAIAQLLKGDRLARVSRGQYKAN
jgi:hypothetical protein